MPPTQPPLSTILTPLICGTATFNNQYNTDVSSLPCNAIISRALSLGVTAFDTSPYYGPSESLLGSALLAANHPRTSYQILTKVGRIGGAEFDYSPEWIRYSIQRSLQRLNTTYLDVVYCHDVEFVSAEEVLGL
jgi:D-arabinose 1-dehydrogenase